MVWILDLAPTLCPPLGPHNIIPDVSNTELLSGEDCINGSSCPDDRKDWIHLQREDRYGFLNSLAFHCKVF
ncbi:Uncharacterized protein HZ326_5012 [Fusarium oxysporum f. sp. albedinis]|nr:Uncharacterized protein HZ326_5012 [Fusarium oxysporum f. sp. albedinis]